MNLCSKETDVRCNYILAACKTASSTTLMADLYQNDICIPFCFSINKQRNAKYIHSPCHEIRNLSLKRFWACILQWLSSGKGQEERWSCFAKSAHICLSVYLMLTRTLSSVWNSRRKHCCKIFRWFFHNVLFVNVCSAKLCFCIINCVLDGII